LTVYLGRELTFVGTFTRNFRAYPPSKHILFNT